MVTDVDYYLGVDLGQRRDYSAMAVVSKFVPRRKERNWATWGYDVHEGAPVFRLEGLERLALETTYPNVVRRVKDAVQILRQQGSCTVVVDATGVGGPVVDWLRKADLQCPIVPVIITGADRATVDKGVYNTPRRDLLAAVGVLLADHRLKVKKGLAAWPALKKELQSLGKDGQSRGCAHDDLAMAAALACWRARFTDYGYKRGDLGVRA